MWTLSRKRRKVSLRAIKKARRGTLGPATGSFECRGVPRGLSMMPLRDSVYTFSVQAQGAKSARREDWVVSCCGVVRYVCALSFKKCRERVGEQVRGQVGEGASPGAAAHIGATRGGWSAPDSAAPVSPPRCQQALKMSKELAPSPTENGAKQY